MTQPGRTERDSSEPGPVERDGNAPDERANELGGTDPAESDQKVLDEPPSSPGSKVTSVVRRIARAAVYGQPMPARWLALGTFAVYAVYSLTRHAQLLTAGYDLGIFHQAVSDYAALRAPESLLKGIDYHLLGDHFHPILAVLAPLYWVWDDPRMLLLAQAALVGWSTLPVFAFAARRFDRRTAMLGAIGYALCWPLQGLADFDFHEIAFAVPLLAVAIDALDRRSMRAVIVASVLLLLVREDLGATVAMIGVIAAWNGSLAVGLGLVAAGCLAFLLVVKVVIPHFSSNGDFAYWSYGILGDGPGESLKAILTRPHQVVAAFVSPFVKVQTLAALLAPWLFAPLLSRYLLIALPLIAQRFLNTREALWTIEFHYSAPLAPILAMAAFDTFDRLARRFRWNARVLTALLTVPVIVAVIGMLVATAAFPFGRLVNGAAWRTPDGVSDARAALALVPTGSCVAADDRLVPQLVRDHYVTLPGRSDQLVDWMVIDRRQAETGWLAPPPDVAIADAVDLGFVTAGEVGEFLVLRRPGDIVPGERCRDYA